MATLEDWGWDDGWAKAFGPVDTLLPARVIEEQRGAYKVAAASGESTARLPGAVRRALIQHSELPAVGDWVAIEPTGDSEGLVRRVLRRRTKLSRKAAGETHEEQVIAANLDAVLIMTALNSDFNARRLERFLAVCRESGAATVVVLNKLDVCPDPGPYLAEAKAVAGAAPVLTLSAKTGASLEALGVWLSPGKTVGLVGSSGVGKSTLVNRLAGLGLRTAETRASDERGRHTTTHRQLFLIPGGGMLVDTPGMREMQFWEAGQGVSETFAEIETLAAGCRFKDCAHEAEPGCAVKAGAAAGAVAAERLEAWRKLRRELGKTLKKRLKDKR